MAYLNITGVDLKDLAKAAYRLSRPQGLGFMHFEECDLPDDLAQQLVDHNSKHMGGGLSMDYVKGRACKFNVWNINGELFIRDRWYDHSEYDLQDLLKAIGKTDAPKVEELPERVAA